MVMPQVAFDTLEYAKELEEAGVEPKMAEAHTRAQVRVLSDFVDRQIATKSDLKELEIKFDSKFDQIDNKFEQIDSRFKQIDSRFKQIDSRFEQINDRFGQVDSRFDLISSKIEISEQKLMARIDRIESLTQKLSSRLMKVSILGVGLISGLISIYHFW